MFRKKNSHSRVGRSTFFSPVSLLAYVGIACNLFTMFFAHSFNECILYLLYDLCCDEPASSRDNFLLQFSFSELSITSGFFHQKSNRVVICRNVVPILPLRCLFFCAFVLIGKSIV